MAGERVKWQGRVGTVMDRQFNSALVHFDGDPPAERSWCLVEQLDTVDELDVNRDLEGE